MRPTNLVVRFSSLGDVILTSATVMNLAIHFGNGISYLTKERFRPIVELMDGVDEVITIPDDVSLPSYVTRLLSLDAYSNLIDLHGNFRSMLARRLVSSEVMTIYPKRRNERKQAVRRDDKVIPVDYPHTIDAYNSTLDHVGAPVYVNRPILSPTPVARASQPTVVIAPGAAHPPKQWGEKNFADLAERLHHDFGANVIWARTSNDTPVSELIDGPTGHVQEFVDQSIPELAAIISSAYLTIANDSGIAHLSSAVGTPTLALFGPTHPVLGFAPQGLFDRVVQAKEPCRPCSLHGKAPCFREEQFCFTRMSIEHVARVASEMLKHSLSLNPALFLDRDGTVIVEKEFLHDPDQVELESGAVDAIRLAQDNGYKVVIVSNQSGVARGMFGLDAVEAVNRRTQELLESDHANIDGIYYCPYHRDGTVPEFAMHSYDRKPAPGMPEQAAVDLGIDLRRSIVIGDRRSDLDLGRAIGGRFALVRTGYGREAELKLEPEVYGEHFAFDTVLDAVRHFTSTKS